MKYASLNNSHNHCHGNYTNRIFVQKCSFKSIDWSLHPTGRMPWIILHLWGFLCVRDAGRRGNRITEIAQNDQPTESLSGQMVTLAGHCLLTGCYFKLCVQSPTLFCKWIHHFLFTKFLLLCLHFLFFFSSCMSKGIGCIVPTSTCLIMRLWRLNVRQRFQFLDADKNLPVYSPVNLAC